MPSPSTPPLADTDPSPSITTDHAPPSAPSSPLAKRPKVSSPPPPTTTASHMTTSNMLTAASTSTSTPAVAPLSSAPPLLIKKLTETARLPTRGSAFSAGYDLYASSSLTIPARGKALVNTGLAIAVPEGTYGRVAPRSGLASKHFIDVGAGVIDADYRGELKVLLFNFGEADFEVKEGERVAQLVVERIYTPDVVEVQELEESVRGAGGFGSTG